ncbi:hypothetical protein MVES_003736 [Malassezia vespertilionis]|uniref:Uncharacterized protein n=2 Tax=Malassezia vespertilionis TaxID=2020962 RepID=A0A2N1J711_9BASI|nr:hypothetical protein MVES_003736 [Malassezia vespertilionis]
MSETHGESLTELLDEAFRLASLHSPSNTDDSSQKALRHLGDAARMADALAVISENDCLWEISTRSLRVFLIPSLQTELESNLRPKPDGDRMMQRRKQVEAALGAGRLFFASVQRHKALPHAVAMMTRQQVLNSEKENTGNRPDPGERRHLKIQLLQLERQVKQYLDAFRTEFRNAQQKRDPQSSQVPPASNDPFYDLLILSGSVNDDDDDDEIDQVDITKSPTYETRQPRNLREYLLMLIVLHAIRTSSTMETAQQELELLRMVPQDDARAEKQPLHESEWRLDSRWFAGKSGGPLLGEQGKPLRPFVITGSSAGGGAAQQAPGDQRSQLREAVFRPSHRLPTMSIDQYLEEERRRGNIIESDASRGQDSTPRERRTELAELDGTRAGEEAEEAARREAIHWDTYTETHMRGAGNTMNRG